ncbi:MAG TPA: hypothetical protein VN580_12285, partial [Clostridia bacterium]|nr:hypothetical protein [Clostridia bacterium]
FKAVYSKSGPTKQDSRKEPKRMNMKIEIIPPCKMAYIRQNGPYGSGNALAMERLKKSTK